MVDSYLSIYVSDCWAPFSSSCSSSQSTPSSPNPAPHTSQYSINQSYKQSGYILTKNKCIIYKSNIRHKKINKLCTFLLKIGRSVGRLVSRSPSSSRSVLVNQSILGQLTPSYLCPCSDWRTWAGRTSPCWPSSAGCSARTWTRTQTQTTQALSTNI